jgi:hypothetical protein
MAFSDGFECPHCQTRLEVDTGSRIIAVTVGLVAAYIAWWFTRYSTNILGFALPVLLSFLAFGIVSALMLLFVSRLCIAPAVVVLEPAAAIDGHGASPHDHAGGHH